MKKKTKHKETPVSSLHPAGKSGKPRGMYHLKERPAKEFRDDQRPYFIPPPHFPSYFPYSIKEQIEQRNGEVILKVTKSEWFKKRSPPEKEDPVLI